MSFSTSKAQTFTLRGGPLAGAHLSTDYGGSTLDITCKGQSGRYNRDGEWEPFVHRQDLKARFDLYLNGAL